MKRSLIVCDREVQAILAGTKSQIIRPVKIKNGLRPFNIISDDRKVHDYGWADESGDPVDVPFDHSFGKLGDILYLKETFSIVPASAYKLSRDNGEPVPHQVSPDGLFWAIYREGWVRSASGFKWRSPACMPRWASRIQLEIQDIRINKLNYLTSSDAKLEGFLDDQDLFKYLSYIRGEQAARALPIRLRSAKEYFIEFWNGKYPDVSWKKNPWVWTISFRRLHNELA